MLFFKSQTRPDGKQRRERERERASDGQQRPLSEIYNHGRHSYVTCIFDPLPGGGGHTVCSASTDLINMMSSLLAKTRSTVQHLPACVPVNKKWVSLGCTPPVGQ